MTPHRIRLRGFWETTRLDGGRVRHLRRFGRPRTLDPGETAWVVGESVRGRVAVSLNGQELGRLEAGPGFAFDVTTKLLPRNELTIEAAEGEELGEVVLEIRPAGKG